MPKQQVVKRKSMGRPSECIERHMFTLFRREAPQNHRPRRPIFNNYGHIHTHPNQERLYHTMTTGNNRRNNRNCRMRMGTRSRCSRNTGATRSGRRSTLGCTCMFPSESAQQVECILGCLPPQPLDIRWASKASSAKAPWPEELSKINKC